MSPRSHVEESTAESSVQNEESSSAGQLSEGCEDDGRKKEQETADGERCARCVRISPTMTLPALVMIDMTAVALVVPLLQEYFKSAGITSATQREWLSSLFSTSQIIGAVFIGGLSDAGILSRRNTLLLSFWGSAVSYALIGGGNLAGLVLSRVLVGLVKQTVTVCTALLAAHTTNEDRSIHMGRLSASSTVAWIVGPSAGALLYKYVHTAAPPLVASGIFLLSSAMAALLLPRELSSSSTQPSSNTSDSCLEIDMQKRSSTTTTTVLSTTRDKFSSFQSKLKKCFGSKTLGSVVFSLLLYHWVSRATSYATIPSYYQEMYGIEPHQRGYLTSYQGVLSFVVQSFLVRPLLKFWGGERNAACVSVYILAAASFMEVGSSLPLFLVLICPMVSVSTVLLSLSLKSLVTQVAPNESLGSVLAALDMMQNAAAVTVPFYRTMLFSLLGCLRKEDDVGLKRMTGDPCSYLWLKSSGLHWLLTSFCLSMLLLRSSIQTTTAASQKLTKKSNTQSTRKEKKIL